MKKLTAILLAFTILFAFTACGSETLDEDDLRGEQVVNTTEAPAPSEDVPDTPDTDVTHTPDTDVTEPEFSLGNIEGLNYENSFIGIGCNLPSDWVFYTDEQIKELNNLSTELAGEEFMEAMENAQVVYDMFASTNDQLKNINVNLEKFNPITLAMTDIADIHAQSKPLIKQSFENMGYTNITFEHDTVDIDGETFACMRLTGENNGIIINQLGFSKKCNGYLANITITSYNEDSVDSLLDYFYLVK